MFGVHCNGIIAVMSPPATAHPTLPLRRASLFTRLFRFPWRSSVAMLKTRFREDRLGLTASSLTFTTVMALVPFITVALAVFTAFPMFARFQGVLQTWLINSLIPENISRQVLGYLTQFALQASKMGVVGVALLLVTALALILTIDHTLNGIWRVRQPRPFGQRVLVYWSAITLGPLLLGVSLSITSYVLSASKGLVGVVPGGVQVLLDIVQFLLVAGAMAALYHYVPNTHVKWRHAWVGGVFVAAGLELAKKMLALYLSQVPSYSVVYGAFATVPIFLIWIYIAWMIVLLGAVITAYLPSLLTGTQHREAQPGLPFQLALETLQQLTAARAVNDKGLTTRQLAQALRVDTLELEPVLSVVCELDWIGLLQEELKTEEARYVLLVNPDCTPLSPLLQVLLLGQDPQTDALWKHCRWTAMALRDVL